MTKRKRILTWALLPVAVLAVMLAVEVVCQVRVLTLPREQRALSTLPPDALTVAEAVSAGEGADGEDEWAEEWETDDDADAPVPDDLAEGRISLSPGQSAVITYDGYVRYLMLTGIPGTDSSYHLTWRDVEGRTHQKDCVFFSMAGGDVQTDAVFIGGDVTEITLGFTNSFALQGISVDNRVALNGNRMLLSGLMSACFYLLIALRRIVTKKPEVGFLLVALAAGIYMSVGLPATVGFNYDDAIHYRQVQLLSRGRNAFLTQSEWRMSENGWSLVMGESFVHPGDTARDEQALHQLLNATEDADIAEEQTMHWQFSDVGYLNQAAGAAVARWLRLPFAARMVLPRVVNMLTYVGLVYLAIRSVKRFKLTLCAIALMVTPVFLSASYTYDTVTNALCLLGTALAVDAILDRETPLSWQRGMGILISLLLGAMSKVVYMPLLLLALLLPRKKFASGGACVWYKMMAALICLAGVLTMVASVNTGEAILTDSRGNAADSSAQLAFILAHPLTYLGYFFSTMWKSGVYYWTEATRCTMAYVGNLNGIVSTLSLWLILFTAVTDNDPDIGQGLRWRQRLAMLVIVMMTAGLVFTTMYLAFSAVGASDFSGVQGRYLIPVLPLAAMLLSPRGLHNRMNKTGWHLFFFTANAAVLLWACWNSILNQFYL